MISKTITVLPGDGVGPEVTKEAVKILKAVGQKFGHQFHFQEGLIGEVAIEKTGQPLPSETLKLCHRSHAILFGAVGHPKYDAHPEFKIRPEQGLLQLRKALRLYANLRPIKIFPFLEEISPLKKEKSKMVDFLVVRELTGGIYFGKPRKRIGQKAFDTCVYTQKEIQRVGKMAFDFALKRRKKLTLVDKANVLETSRLWRETVKKLSQNYPQVSLDYLYVDNAAMQIIKNPSWFDVILTENMFGDILTDEAAGLVGSIGLLPSASIGEKFALYEPIHGSFPRAAGKNLANPLAAILSAVMLLEISFGLKKEAQVVIQAIEETLKNGFRTKDIAGKKTPPEKILGTKEMGEKIRENLEKN